MIITNKNNRYLVESYKAEIKALKKEGFEKYTNDYIDFINKVSNKEILKKGDWTRYTVEDKELDLILKLDINKKIKGLHITVEQISTGDKITNLNILNTY